MEPSMKILITGANGCIGNVLVKQLIDSGHEITALAIDANDTDKIKKFDNLKIVLSDICNKEQIEEIFFESHFQVVIHLAGIVHKSEATLKQCMAVNCEATSHLFELSKKYNVAQFVFASTVAIYGDDCVDVLDEASPARPQTPYAISKYKAEEYIERNHFNSIKYTIIRPATVYGKYDKGNVNKLFKIVKKGIVPVIGDGTNIKSFVYVENLVNGIIKTLMNPVAYNEIFIISDKKAYSVNEVVAEIAKVINKKVFIIRLPERILMVILKAVNVICKVIMKKEFLNSGSIKNLTTNNYLNISKAEKILNYSPKYSLEQGIRRTYGN